MTIAIGFITYQPDDSFFSRLSIAAEFGGAVYVYDNSPECVITSQACACHDNVKYFTSGENAGLGVGLAVLGRNAFGDDQKAMLFFDQDTRFSSETLDYIFAYYSAHQVSLSEKYVSVTFDAKSRPGKGIEDVRLVINSGSLFVLENLNDMGWHNQSYFVDGVDYELCLRAREFGFLVGMVGNTPGFDHESEQPDRFVSFGARRLALRRYPAWRLWDSIKAYSRMIFYTMRKFDFFSTVIVLRSMAIFVLGQLIAISCIRNKK